MPSKLKTNVRPLPVKMIEYSDDALVEGLRTELRKYLQTGGTYKALSEKCGGYPLSVTISRVANGESIAPRLTTVIALYVALGFSIKAIRFGK